MMQVLERLLRRFRRRCVDCGGVIQLEQIENANWGNRQRGYPVRSRWQLGRPPHHQRCRRCWVEMVNRWIDEEGTVGDVQGGRL